MCKPRVIFSFWGSPLSFLPIVMSRLLRDNEMVSDLPSPRLGYGRHNDVALNGCDLTFVKIQALWCLNNLAVALVTYE